MEGIIFLEIAIEIRQGPRNGVFAPKVVFPPTRGNFASMRRVLRVFFLETRAMDVRRLFYLKKIPPQLAFVMRWLHYLQNGKIFNHYQTLLSATTV